MDKKIESSNAEKVRRRVANLLKEYGFARTKSTFYTRSLSDRIEFVHLHKFTFTPAFRAHIGIRFYCDPFEASALNGPDSDPYRYNREYTMRFWKEEETLDCCASNILDFVKNIGFTWFEKWKDNELLLTSQESPLPSNLKAEYLMMLKGVIDKDTSDRSCKLLGIKQGISVEKECDY